MRIDYKKGLRSLLRINHSNRKLDAESTNLLTQILNDINRQLVVEFDSEYEAYGADPDKPFQLFAQKAVERTFKGNLKKHAISEAARQLALFETGCMNYDPDFEFEKIKTIVKAKKSKRKEKAVESRTPVSPEMAFKSGIAKMCQADLTLDRRAKHYLGQHLHNFTRMVGQRALEIAASKEQLEPVDLKQAVAQFFGPGVTRIANSEGNRSLVLYANGFLTFRPKQQESEKEQSKKKSEVQEEGSGRIFRNGIRRFLYEFNQDTSIDPKASKVVEDAVFDVGTFLSLYVAGLCRESEINEIRDVELNYCVQELFPELLKQHALIQGNTDVENFLQGILRYKWRSTNPPSKTLDLPELRERGAKPPHRKRSGRSAPTLQKGKQSSGKLLKPRSKKKQVEGPTSGKSPRESTLVVEPRTSIFEPSIPVEKAKKKEKRLDFTSGLLDLCPSVFPSLKISFHRDATNEIGKMLDEICQRLASKAGETTQVGTSLGIEDIKDAVEQVFPAELSHHAMSFASSIVMLNLANITEGGSGVVDSH